VEDLTQTTISAGDSRQSVPARIQSASLHGLAFLVQGMSTLIATARAQLAGETNPTRRLHLTGRTLVFEAACAMDDSEPDKQARIAVAWARLKALVEVNADGA